MPLKSRCDLKKTQLSAYLPLNDKLTFTEANTF